MRNVLLVTLFLISGIWGTSCKMLRTARHDVRDSVVTRYRDSTVYRTETNTRDSVVLRDSVVRVAGSDVSVEVPVGSTNEVSRRSGHVTISRRVVDGREVISASCDSLEILVPALRWELHTVKVRSDSLQRVVLDSHVSHKEETVKVVERGWLGRLWERCKNVMAWWGLICAIVLVLWLVRKAI